MLSITSDINSYIYSGQYTSHVKGSFSLNISRFNVKEVCNNIRLKLFLDINFCTLEQYIGYEIVHLPLSKVTKQVFMLAYKSITRMIIIIMIADNNQCYI